jgi:putative FmdB family regulatory protein
MPFYDHLCEACNHEWEDFYSMTTNPPTLCPSCNTEGKVKRLISDSYSVRVPATGRDLVDKIKKERQQITQNLKKDENAKANVVGESAYHEHKLSESRLSDNLKQI